MKGLIVVFALLFGKVQWSFSQSPSFAVITTTGDWYYYSEAEVSDDIVSATIVADGDFWTLDLTANTSIESIRFPYENERQELDDDFSNDIYYYPILGGGTVQAPAHDIDWNWYGKLYPGEIFAPIVITADSDNARIVAATNWPVKPVTPYYAAQRVQMDYSNLALSSGDEVSLSCLIAEVEVDPSSGEVAWQSAMDKYRNWLDEQVETPSYPEVIKEMHGYFFIGLTDWPEFELTEISETWAQWRSRLPWMQVWGQMSNYAGPPEFAVPPLEPGEVVDCCYPEFDIHPRYLPSFVDFMRDSVVGLGYLGGYYSAPYLDIWGAEGALLLDTDEGVEWLSDWLDQNQFEYEANAHYVDILGRKYWGDPEVVRSHFDGEFIRDTTLIEGSVDIYPAAGLMSGCLIGMEGFPGGPDITPETSIEAAFPPMERYLLNDRIVFMGPSNGDALFMGPLGDYWLERQTFILGAKFEVSHPNNDWNPLTPNPMLTLALDKRDEFDWWARMPRYQHTKGITNMPEGIEVRRFIDNSGCDLFVIDNWNEQVDQTFDFEGESYSISSEKLSIIDLCLLSVKTEFGEKNAFEVYPNPTSNSFIIQAQNPLDKETILIWSSTGELVKQVSNLSGNKNTISVVDLSKGVYFVEIVRANNGLHIEKLIIQ